MTTTATAEPATEPVTTPVEGQAGEGNKPAEIVFEHLKLMQEENLNTKNLPKNIQGKMSGLRMVVGRYNKNPADTLLKEIKKQDVVIADLIQTFVEEEAEKKKQNSPEAIAQRDADAKAKADADAKAKADADKAIADKAKADADAKAKEEEENNKPDVKMEKAVRAKMVNGMITTTDLTAILGRKPSTWGKEKIGGLTIKKAFVRGDWIEQK